VSKNRVESALETIESQVGYWLIDGSYRRGSWGTAATKITRSHRQIPLYSFNLAE